MEVINRILGFIQEADVSIPKVDLGQGTVDTVMSIIFGLAGAVAVIIITIAGIQYVISQGEPDKTRKAKDAILYTLIGLAVTVLAFAIVRFVMRNL